jgi:hypothetical protein
MKDVVDLSDIIEGKKRALETPRRRNSLIKNVVAGLVGVLVGCATLEYCIRKPADCSIGYGTKTISVSDKRDDHALQTNKNAKSLEDISSYNIDVQAMKSAISLHESNDNIKKINRYSGAAGRYQYMPSTALGLIRQARKKGIKITYHGPMTKWAISRALINSEELNEALIEYDLIGKRRKFDENPGLIAMGHYAKEDDIIGSLRIVYPGKQNYGDVDINHFAIQRAKMGNRWLVRPQAKGHPSILDYAESIRRDYEKLRNEKMSLVKI